MFTAENYVANKEKERSLRLVLLIFLLAAGLLTGGIFISYRVGLVAIRAQDKIAEELSILNQILDVLDTLKDAETGQRGYLLTNELPYLEPYNAALTNVQRKLDALRQLSLNNKISETKFRRLDELVQKKLTELNLVIEVNKNQGFTAALKALKTDRGKELMDEIRIVLNELKDEERVKFTKAGEDTAWANKVRIITFILVGFMNLIFLTWAGRKISWETNRREDISRRINQQRELLITTLASIGDGVIITDDKGRVIYINPESERLTGWTNEQAKGQMLPAVFRIINETTRQVVVNPVEKVIELGAVVGLANHTILIKKDGTEIPIDDSTAPIRQPDGKLFGVVLVFRDFSEHKKSEASLKGLNQQLSELTNDLERRVQERTMQLEEQAGQLRQLAVELIEVEEKERTRLAQILHDHLQQLLVAVKMRLELLIRKSTEEDKITLTEMNSYIQQAYESSRSLTAELRPPVLYEAGLEPALNFLAKKFETEQKLKINLSIFSGAEPASDLLKVMIYQSVQEALLNIVKYAGTNECSLKVEKSSDGRIRITVRDEGAGFDPKKIGQKGTGGFGLFSIRERIKALGGEFKIESEKGKGTTFEMVVPREVNIG